MRYTITRCYQTLFEHFGSPLSAVREAYNREVKTPFTLSSEEGDIIIRRYDCLIDKETINKAVKHIEEHPIEYDQASWCGTSCCIIGHARYTLGTDQVDEGLLIHHDLRTPYLEELKKFSECGSANVLNIIKNITSSGVVEARGEVLCNLNLKDMDIERGSFIDCDFTGSRFINVVFDSCDLTGCIFDNCSFTGTSFTDCILDEATFSRSKRG